MSKNKLIHKRWIWFCAAGFVVAMVVAAWHLNGVGNRESRLSTLRVLAVQLRRYAQRHGHYPAQLGDAFEDKKWAEEWLADVAHAEGLHYVAAGKAYCNASNRRLFYERHARRYGFGRGWFDIHVWDWKFREGEPALSAGQ